MLLVCFDTQIYNFPNSWAQLKCFRFDLREFHRTILRCLGPLSAVEECVAAFVTKTPEEITNLDSEGTRVGGGGNAWGQKFITWPPKPNTYHRYKPFCLKDHILLVKKKSFPGNITFWTEMAILTLIEISYIFILAGLGPKWFVLQSWTQRQSCRAHKIGQFCHQDRPSIPLCSKVRDRAIIAFLLAQKW